jgi:hypothetical protein
MHECDAKDVTQSFQSIAEVMNVPMQITELECNNTSMPQIRKWCSKIEKKDTAVMYYSGPNPKKAFYKGHWPLITIGKSALPVGKVAKEIHSKKARLSLIFVDCYNKFYVINGIERRTYGTPLEPVIGTRLRKKVRNLWMSAHGTLTLCSKKQGKLSYGTVIEGGKTGTFTESLLMAIDGGIRGYYPHLIKLSDFPSLIRRRMKMFPLNRGKKQLPFYQSTLHEVK